MEPLYGARLKISRAESEIKRLRRQENVFLQESSYRVVRAELNSDTGNYVYHVSTSGLPPCPQWSVEIGEIAHNLRSALNYLVYQLALLETKAETVAADRLLQFPISARRVDFRDKGNRNIRLLKLEHKTFIEGLQPYQGEGINLPLIWLEDLNNADKHRLIQTVAVRNGFGPAMSYWDRDIVGRPFDFASEFVILEDGAKLGEAPTQVHVTEYISPLIAFWEGCERVKYSGVIYVLDKICTRVSDIIEGSASKF